MSTVHVITTNEQGDRYQSVSQLLHAMGFMTQPMIVPWSDPEFVGKLNLIPADAQTGRRKGLLSNAIAQFRAWRSIASDPSGDDWGFVMEDDARLHVDIPESDARQVIADFLARCEGYDFAYLGICRPREFSERTPQPSSYKLEMGIASGYGCHAYAIRRQLAHRLEDDLYSSFGGPGKLVLKALDSRLSRYWSRKRGVPVCGINLLAPREGRQQHRGLFFQDRKRFKSQLSRLNKGFALDFSGSDL